MQPLPLAHTWLCWFKGLQGNLELLVHPKCCEGPTQNKTPCRAEIRNHLPELIVKISSYLRIVQKSLERSNRQEGSPQETPSCHMQGTHPGIHSCNVALSMKAIMDQAQQNSSAATSVSTRGTETTFPLLWPKLMKNRAPSVQP